MRNMRKQASTLSLLVFFIVLLDFSVFSLGIKPEPFTTMPVAHTSIALQSFSAPILPALVDLQPINITRPEYYYEYPSIGWEVVNTTYLDQFIEWDFMLVGGKTVENLKRNPYLEWNVTWRQKPLLEVYDEKAPDVSASAYANPYLEYSKDSTREKTASSLATLTGLSGFNALDVVKFSSDLEAGHNYPVRLVDSKQSILFTKMPATTIDVYTNGSFIFSVKKWQLGIGLKLGSASTYVYSSATNTITVTGGTVGAPITFNDLWTQDKAGYLVLDTRTGIGGTDGSADNYAINLRPADEILLGGAKHDYYLNVSSWSAGMVSATIMLKGTDENSAAKNENITVNGNGQYLTSTLFKTSTQSQVVAFDGPSSTFTYTLSQGQWGVVWKQRVEYEIDSLLIIGDGSTATYFGDTSKQVFFNIANAANAKIIRVRGAATLRLGQLFNASKKSTGNGCDIRFGLAAWARVINGDSGSTIIYLYSCHLGGDANFDNYLWDDGAATFHVWNTVLDRVVPANFGGTFFNVTVSGTTMGLNAPGAAATLDRVVIVYCTFWALRIFNNATVNNLYARNHNQLAVFEANAIINVINADIEAWTYNWNGKTATVYRQYTVNIVVYDSPGVAVQNANTTLWNGASTKVWSVLTGINGSFAEKTTSRGYYAQSTGNTLQDYGPFTLTVSKSGYDTYTHENIVLDEPLDWRISLVTGITAAQLNYIPLTIIMSLCFFFTGIYFHRRTLVPSVLAMMTWFTVAGYWLITTTLPGVALVFFGVGLIMVVYTISEAMNLLKPTSTP